MSSPEGGPGMLLSVIINNYNYGSYLGAAIDSALAQTYQPLEVIVVDDGSTDNSRQVIAGYGDRITPVLKENGGQASTFNAGFARSQGELIIFLDADDILRPGIAARAAEAYGANPAVAKIMYHMDVLDASGERTGEIKLEPRLRVPSGDVRRYTLTCPFDMTWMPTSGNAFPASVLRHILPVPEQVYGRVGADWYVAHIAPLFGPIMLLDDIGAGYRVHGANSYEVSGERTGLNLDHVRQTVVYTQHTEFYIRQFAWQLGLNNHAPDANTTLPMSVSALAHRIVSLKLDLARHPFPADRAARLCVSGARAALRRFDVSWPMRLAFASWFAAMLPAPRPLARWLAEAFLLPQTSGFIGGILKVLRRN